MLNDDLAKPALMRGGAMDWVESPAAGVWRKRFYLHGGAETGRVTSIVRYDAGSRFPSHEHPEGEEILVLSGTFSDHTGDWGKGAYLLNPEGSPHAPHSEAGCTLFVHLRQYRGAAFRRIDTTTAPWQPGRFPGLEQITLQEEDGGDGPLHMRLLRLAPETIVPEHPHAGGEEILVIDGELVDDSGSYAAGTWLRYPPGHVHSTRSQSGCTLYVRNGGLGLASD